MSIGKREKLMIIVLGILVYLLLFYYVAWVPTIPQIKDKSQELIKLTQQKSALDEEVKNIQTKKIYLSSLQTVNERLDNYLIDNADITDCVEYVNKLNSIIGRDLGDINVSAPQMINVGNQGPSQYYRMDFNINSFLNYNEIMEVTDYIEGSTVKTAISNFIITGVKDKAILQTLLQQKPVVTVAPTPPPAKGNRKATKQAPVTQTTNLQTVINPNGYYQVSLTISLYSTQKAAVDKIYDFSTNKLNEYDKTDTIPFNPESVK